MRETFSIFFYLKKGKNGQNQKENIESTIYCRISVCGTKSPFSTLLKIDPACWNQATKRAEGKGMNISKINKALARLETTIWEHYEKLKREEKNLPRNIYEIGYWGNIKKKIISRL